MPSITVYAKDFDGYTPAVDPRRSDKPFVIDGANFVFDVDGPKSFFGSEIFDYTPFEDMDYTTAFTIEGRGYVFTLDAVYAYSDTERAFYPVFTFDRTSEIWPWSSARCGNNYFFCRKGLGVIYYNATTQTWHLVDNEFFPFGACWVCDSNGRLIVLGLETYAWSALDDGLDMTPSLITGAGFQSTFLVGGHSFRIDRVLDGFIVSTSEGIIKAQFTSGASVWRHFPLSTFVKLISPFTAAPISDNDVVLLAKTGLFHTQGQEPEAWEPVMSEDLKANQFPTMDLTIPNLLRLHYSKRTQLFFISFSSTTTPGSYYEARVLYLPLANKWGLFNKQHRGLLDFAVASGPVNGENLGFIAPTGQLNLFYGSPNTELEWPTSVPVLDMEWKVSFDYPMREEDGVVIASTSMHFWRENPIAWSGLVSGRYVLNGIGYYEEFPDLPEDPAVYEETGVEVAGTNVSVQNGLILWAAEVVNPNLTGLAAYVHVGLFRFVEQVHADETSTVENLLVGAQLGEAKQTIEDYMLEYAGQDHIEDWMLGEPDQFADWGFNTPSQAVYDVTLITTNDGTIPIVSGPERPYMYENMGASRLYAPEGYSGLYHSIRVDAQAVGETFRLKLLELTGNLTGRFEA